MKLVLALLIFAAVPVAYGQTHFQPTSYGAALISPSGSGTDWTPATGSGTGVYISPNNYVGLLICVANCSNGLAQQWSPVTSLGGGGGGSTAISTNGTTNTSQTALNFLNNGPFVFTNPSAGNEQVGVASGYYFPTGTDQANWNAKQAAITLTTTGSSGPATLSGATLNIPQYSGGTGSGTVNSGTAYSPAYYSATGTAVSGITPCNGLELLSTTASPACATPAQVQAAGTDSTKNSSAIFQQESSPGGADVGVPTPTAGQDILAYTGGALKESKNGGTYAPICTYDGTTALNCPSGGATLQTNSTANGSQTLLNFVTSTTNAAGLTATPVNSAGTEKIEITGTPTQPTDAAYTVAGNPTGTSATRAATTNPKTATVSTYAASGNPYWGMAAGGVTTCDGVSQAGCDTFLSRPSAGLISADTTTAGNGLGAFKEALHTPTSSAEACVVGTIRWDATYLYICTATNTYKRVALTAF